MTTSADCGVFNNVHFSEHEQTLFCHDPETNLHAIIAIHSTALGPALGGARFCSYRDEADALNDALRLSQGMSAKAALAGLPLGGGKAVIVGNPSLDRTDDLIRAFGRMVHSLGGRYITAEDVGTTVVDMNLIAQETPYVTGTSSATGGSGDPSPSTALGVYMAMQAVATKVWGSADLEGRHVVISGAGKVGSALAGLLSNAGAHLEICDIDTARSRAVAKGAGATVIPADTCHEVCCDIFAPCALGGILNRTSIPALRCRAVVGAANNQLEDLLCGELLDAAGVLYAPDFVVNAGGLIHVAAQLTGFDPLQVERRVRQIFGTVLDVLGHAERTGLSTAAAAVELAKGRMS